MSTSDINVQSSNGSTAPAGESHNVPSANSSASQTYGSTVCDGSHVDITIDTSETSPDDLDMNKPQTYPLTPQELQANNNNNNNNNNENTLLLPIHRTHPEDDDDDRMSKIIKLAKRPSFIWIFSLGILALIIFQLTFLPRTSLSRDYRRWHGIHLTKSDVKRNFLQFTGIGNSHRDLTTEEYIDNWLYDFTTINNKAKFNLLSDDNPELSHYVETNFKDFGFDTKGYSYNVEMQTPRVSVIKLRDQEDEVVYQAKILEPKFKTPGFFSYGVDGNVTAGFVFVNYGTPEDYSLLLSSKIDLKGKIFIIKNHLQEQNITVGEKVALAEHHGAVAVLTFFDSGSLGNEETSSNLNFAISRDCNSEAGKIPVVPISRKLLLPVLDTQREVPYTSSFEKWEYMPSSANSKFKLELDSVFNKPKHAKLTNIVGTLKGIMNDADVIIGARRDSLTSNSPLSGHAIMFEIMRNYQRLIEKGWKPLRNIKFVSWDGSYMDSLGTKLFTNDTEVFNPKRSVVSYINLDADAVTGSKFDVDSNPLMNHLLKTTSKYIPIPKRAAFLRTLGSNAELDIFEEGIDDQMFDKFDDDDDDGDDDDDDDGEEYTTLHKYWMKQDNATINNNLGFPLINSEARIFQQHLSTPIINLKFSNDEKRDGAKYIPNSNYYSRDWLIKQDIDKDLLLHGSLIRFVGLLAINLSEHEVVDYKTYKYLKLIHSFYLQLLEKEAARLSQWKDKVVSNYLIYKNSIFQDLDTDEEVYFHQIVSQFTSLMNEIVVSSKQFDEYNERVEQGLSQDYPWYMYYKKLQHFAQFKLTNYKLSHLEKDLQLSDQDYSYLESKDPQKGVNADSGVADMSVDLLSSHGLKGILDGFKSNKFYYNSVIYGVPKFNARHNKTWYDERLQKGTFTYLYAAIDDDDYESTVKWFVLIYEKLTNINYKMT
ncbi:hypothetical protein I9W82_000785 [Candida metapsilosis]|uniref:Peptide hydrolase n=1 Tax=Candida metapsilosis TaxID=273372 RepID=A0A8H7ZH79_9ASCO|nr:hypothetical protein I9W82_000785 [Candida metapsilosis]